MRVNVVLRMVRNSCEMLDWPSSSATNAKHAELFRKTVPSILIVSFCLSALKPEVIAIDSSISLIVQLFMVIERFKKPNGVLINIRFDKVIKFDPSGTREKRSAHACLPCFRRIFAIEIIRHNKTN